MQEGQGHGVWSSKEKPGRARKLANWRTGKEDEVNMRGELGEEEQWRDTEKVEGRGLSTIQNDVETWKNF